MLVPGVSVPNWAVANWEQPTTLRIVLNIRRTAGLRLDLSRHDIAGADNNWSDFVLQRCVDVFRKRAKRIVADTAPAKALYLLARRVAYGNGFRKILADVIRESTIPLLTLEKNGHIAIIRPEALKGDIISVVPHMLAKELSAELFAEWASTKWLQGKSLLHSWYGERCVFADGMTYSLTSSREPVSIMAVQQLHQAWLHASHILTGISFLSPHQNNLPPLLQEMWTAKKPANRKSLLRDESIDTANQIKAGLAKLSFDLSYHAPKVVSFMAPFDDFFTAGWKYLNVQHPVVAALAQCIKSIEDKQSVGAITEHDLGMIRDVMRPLFGEHRWGLDHYLTDGEIDERCNAIERLFTLASQLEIFELPSALIWEKQTLNVPFVTKAEKFGARIESLTQVGIY